MPPAVVAAGIAGATTLGGALIGSSAAGKANKAQAAANREALQYQRDKDAEERRRYDLASARFQQRQDAYDQQRRALLRKFGYDAPEPAAPAPKVGPGTGTGGAALDFWRPGGSKAPAAAPPVTGGPAAPPQGLSLGTLMGPRAGAAAPTAGPAPMAAEPSNDLVPPSLGGQSIGDLSGWTDWSRYASPR